MKSRLVLERQPSVLLLVDDVGLAVASVSDDHPRVRVRLQNGTRLEEVILESLQPEGVYVGINSRVNYRSCSFSAATISRMSALNCSGSSL